MAIVPGVDFGGALGVRLTIFLLCLFAGSV